MVVVLCEGLCGATSDGDDGGLIGILHSPDDGSRVPDSTSCPL